MQIAPDFCHMPRPFDDAVPSLLDRLSPGSIEYAILKYLWKNARGCSSAKTWEEIVAGCAHSELSSDRRPFQHGLLADSRSGDVFIGSGPNGYFIVVDREDAKVMADFYNTRIATETQHLNHLNALVRKRGWSAL